MARLYCPKESVIGTHIIINRAEQIHYLIDVLRLKVGDEVFAFDGEMYEYRCQVEEISVKSLKLLIREKNEIKLKKKLDLTIACAIPKQRSRFDDLIDKFSQLGVDKILPMITERVIVRWDTDQKEEHLKRWRKIAQASCTQSGRNILPIIEPVQEINQILAHSESYDLRLIPTASGRRRDLKDIFAKFLAKNILVLIGPEGDFTKQELVEAESKGFVPVSLGDLVLRVETAAIAVSAFFRLNQA